MVLLLLSLFIQPTHATTARVLVDEASRQIEVEGRLRVFCLRHQVRKPVVVESCKKQNSRNKRSRYSFRKRGFLLKLSRNTLTLTDRVSKKRWRIHGRKFRFQGEFTWKNFPLTTLDVFSGNKGTHWVVELPVDKYLQGVLGGEVPSSWPLESLKAQAVASRTYFLWKKKERRSHFDVRSDHMDQVFKMQKKVPKKIRRAVSETRDLVLAQGPEDYFPAYYHSDCGGHTHSEDKVWLKPKAANQNVSDPLCRSAKRNEWNYKIRRKPLLAKLRSSFALPQGVELLAVIPKRKKQERAFVVDLVLSSGKIHRVNANEFRKAIGFGKLKSTHFAVFSQGQSFLFQGRGYGHGVGMCQWGAQRWARKGKTYREILQHYYPLAQLAKLDSRKQNSSQSVAASHGLE